MLPFCANLVVSSAAPAPFTLYEDEKARRQIMKEFAFDQRVARSDQLQEQRDFAYHQQDQALLAHLNDIEESQAQLQREIDEDAFHALLQREIEELFAKLQEQPQAPSAVLFSPAEDDFSQSEKHFGSKQRAQRNSKKIKKAEHLRQQIAFAEEQEARRFGNAQDAEQKNEEYVPSLVHRNHRVAMKAERAPQREADRAERQRKKEAEAENVGSETTETESSLEACGTSEQSTDTRSSRRATAADFFGMPNLRKRYDPAPRFFPKMAIKNRPSRRY